MTIDLQPSVSIRPALSSEADKIAALGTHVFTLTFGHSVPKSDLDAFLEETYTPTAITKDLNNDAIDIIVAVDTEDDILGFAYLTRGSSEPCIDHIADKVELQRVYVQSQAHGRGIGRLLASAIEQMAVEQGFKNIWLGVWEENHKAIRAYEKWGYRRVGDHDFMLGAVVQTDHIMIKGLRAQ